MSFRGPLCLGVFLCAVLSLPALGQSDPIAWTTNIDAAKAEARQTGRFVLVHFWTEDCAPCMALERNVFSQPEVAGALKSQFVPVKLNANDNPSTAAGMGVTRVPTDIVITPDGEVITKMISPATPMAYISELSQAVAKYSGRSGQAYAGMAANAPQPSQLNAAYAGLQVNPATPPALAEANQALAANRFAAARPVGNPSGPLFAAQQVGPGLPAAQSSAMIAPPAFQPAAGAAMPPSNAPTAGPAMGYPQAQPAVMNNQFAQPVANAQQPAPAVVDPNANRYAMAPSVPPLSSATWPTTPTAPAAPPAKQSIANQFAMTTPTATPAATPAAPAYAQTVATSASPDPRQLPPGAMPLGFDGYCPVTMRNSNLTKWVPGNPEHGVQHRGRTYWFAGPQEKQQFWANPDAYAPALSGLDPVMFVDRHQQVPGSREHSIDYNNMFYMFASEASLQQFSANPEKYAVGVREAMGIKAVRTIR